MQSRSEDISGPGDRGSLHVLVADDEPIIRDLLGAILENLRVSVEFAGNGVEAQTMLIADSYQLVITDINMPEMDGIRLLRWLKERYPDVDVVVMTGYDLSEEMVQTIGDNAADYFTKPLDPTKIRAAVQRCRDKMLLRNSG